jgi:ribose transport system substrate-binding protein
VTRIPAGATPEETNAAWTRAAEDKPDVVMSGGASTETYADQLAILEGAGIPVIQYSIPEGVGDGVVANIISVDRFKLQGELMAAYIAAESGGDANAVFFYAPDFAILENEREAFEEAFAEYCPGCAYEGVAISAADIGTALPSQVVAYLQANPDTNWIAGAFAEIFIGVEPALAEAGLLGEVQGIAQGGSPDTYARIVDGELEVADIGMALGFVGYLSVDAAVRALNGDDVSDHDKHLPVQILTADNIDDPTVNWPGIDGYEELFQEIWGL